jgi:hypothetical protein
MNLTNTFSQSIEKSQIEDLEKIMVEFYSRVTTSKYVPLSLADLIIISKDSHMHPTDTKFNYQIIQDSKTYVVKGEILCDKGIPYGLLTYYDDFTCNVPAKFVNGIRSEYSSAEREQIRKLQFKFLSNRMREQQRERVKNYVYISKPCFEDYVLVETSHTYEPKGFFNIQSKVEKKQILDEYWKNVCSQRIIIGGFSMEVFPNSLRIVDASFDIMPGDYHRQVKISDLKNIGSINFNSQSQLFYYFL